MFCLQTALTVLGRHDRRSRGVGWGGSRRIGARRFVGSVACSCHWHCRRSTPDIRSSALVSGRPKMRPVSTKYVRAESPSGSALTSLLARRPHCCWMMSSWQSLRKFPMRRESLKTRLATRVIKALQDASVMFSLCSIRHPKRKPDFFESSAHSGIWRGWQT